MTQIADARALIQQEEVTYKRGVSEFTFYKMGGAVNFLNNRQHSEKQFFANGRYGIMTTYPQLGVDGLTFFEFNATIINAWAFSLVIGTSGITELDIKRATTSGGSFTSIFSTTPKFDSTSAASSWVDALGKQAATTGVTAPVLSVTDIDEGDALRFDIISRMAGTPENCGIIIHYRPR